MLRRLFRSKERSNSSMSDRPQRTSQEFYCGECQGYFLVRLNMALNHEIHVCCPNCNHEHRRVIKEGTIYEDGRYSSDVKERVLTSKATYHKEPVTERMKKAHKKRSWPDRRDGVPMTDDQLMRWHEVAEREKNGAMFDD